jgi:Methylase involved in ubiquinone/menaquinone biosynthesis
MTEGYSSERVRAFYDEYGEREWSRFDHRAADRASLEIHSRFLRRWIQPGDRVLEVGAGPGRFTIQLADIGATVVVGDISPRQLELHRVKVAEADREGAVEARHLLDVSDLTTFPDGSFDAATAYGGPLSYVFEHAGSALDGLLRVVRPDGLVLLSVMSRWGAVRAFLGSILQLDLEGLAEANDAIIATGDLVGEVARVEGVSLPHECHMFTWPELKGLLTGRACKVVDVCAANFLSVRNEEALFGLPPDRWDRFMDWEETACRSEGALDAGTHILLALRRLG